MSSSQVSTISVSELRVQEGAVEVKFLGSALAPASDASGGGFCSGSSFMANKPPGTANGQIAEESAEKIYFSP